MTMFLSRVKKIKARKILFLELFWRHKVDYFHRVKGFSVVFLTVSPWKVSFIDFNSCYFKKSAVI